MEWLYCCKHNFCCSRKDIWSTIKLICNYFDNLYQFKKFKTNSRFPNVTILWFLHSSMTVNWISLSCYGQNKTFEDVVLAFFNIFWHFIAFRMEIIDTWLEYGWTWALMGPNIQLLWPVISYFCSTPDYLRSGMRQVCQRGRLEATESSL